jgi:hypothetical protein
MAEKMDVDSSCLTNPDQKDLADFSIFASKFNVTPSKSNALRWNKDWEKVCNSLPSKDVYSTFALAIKEQDGRALIETVEKVTEKLCDFQTLVTDLWKSLQGLLLDEAECKCHLLKGIQEACQVSPFCEDAPVLCPEITILCHVKARRSSVY